MKLKAGKALKMKSSTGKVKNITKKVKRPKPKIAKKKSSKGVEGMSTDELFAEEFQDIEENNSNASAEEVEVKTKPAKKRKLKVAKEPGKHVVD